MPCATQRNDNSKRCNDRILLLMSSLNDDWDYVHNLQYNISETNMKSMYPAYQKRKRVV